MIVLMGTVFVASLLGSLHCVGMCGPFAIIAANVEGKGSSYWLPTVIYSLGRLLSYVVVGVAFGALGLALNASSSAATYTSWQQSATYVAGGLMIIVGLVALARWGGVKVPLPKVFTPIQKMLAGALARTRQLSPNYRAFVIGALTSLMPCGWLYTFAITAAGTGSPIYGGLLMAAFWLGTIPIMTALMLGIKRIGVSLQKHVPVLMAILVIGVGLFTVFYRAPVAIADDPIVVVTGEQALVQQVEDIDHDHLPCCAKEEE